MTIFRSKNAGFTLILTLSLMMLLIVIGVGMLSLSTVTLRTSGWLTAQREAQCNARMALMLAIADLQKAAGPDQRITASADLAGNDKGESLAFGAAPGNNLTVNGEDKGLTSLQPGTRYWTGVWQNKALTKTTPNLDQLYTITPDPTPIKWLISGNEDPQQPNAFTPADSSISVGSDGRIANSERAVILVGEKTVGAASESSLNRYVSAPLVAINQTKPAGSVGTKNGLSGRYAWWIGDDGTKSTINGTSDLATQKVATYASLSSPRRGWESVGGLSDYPLPNQQSILDRVISLTSLGLVNDGFRQVDGDGSPLNRLFHSATTQSLGVLSDTLRGGLRVDLTPYLNSGFPTSAETDLPNAPKKGGNIIPSNGALTEFNKLKGPKWDLLKDFADPRNYLQNKQLKVRGGDGVTERTIAPTIIDFRLLMGVRLVYVSETNYRCQPCGKFAVTIANPYPYELKWTAPLDFEVRALYNPKEDYDVPGAPNNRFSCIWVAAGQPAFLPFNLGTPSVFGNATFRIDADSLKAGESRAYTLSARVIRPQTADPITIPLSPFSSSSPADMNNCIEMEHSSENNAALDLDVREQWTTSLISLIMRSQDSNNSMDQKIVRRIEHVELDNGFFSSVRRRVDAAKAKVYTSPIPLQLYSFQVSQPGADYASILPGANLMGTRSSTVRTYTDFNLQAFRFSKIITSYNPPPYFMESTDSLAQLPFTEPGGETGLGFTRNLAINPVAWGRKLGAGAQQTVLFGQPDQLVSLAQFQHLDLTADDQTTSVGHQPGNAVGNSYATPFVLRELTRQNRTDYVLMGAVNQTGVYTNSRNYYDMAHMLNTALWDSYFLSSIPQSSQQPQNKSMSLYGDTDAAKAELNSATKSAAHLLVNGSFSVQSTQKDAWKALLASVKHQKHPPMTREIAKMLYFHAVWSKSTLPKTFQRVPVVTPLADSDA